MSILSVFKSSPPPVELDAIAPSISPVYDASLNIEANSQYSTNAAVAPSRYQYYDGDKFEGGFGVTELLTMDYWTLRKRSSQLFTKNLYARGIIRRMVTNEINTGLTLESLPEESVLQMEEDSLGDWADDVEKRYEIYGRSMADYLGQSSLGQLERIVRRESLIEGDILVVLRQDRRSNTPQVQLISGNLIRTPIDKLGANIKEGVELDKNGRHIAFHYAKEDGTFDRIVARGKRSGRRMAWLVYSTDKRHDAVRGEPVLSLILQSLKEIDRYRDAAMRKSVINSLLAMFISKTEDKMGTAPMTGAATMNRSVVDSTPEGDRRFNIADYNAPGVILDELQTGETPHAFKTETDVDFGKFEESVVQAMAWALEIPPEILRLSFSSNYSASQAAINEYKLYLNPTRQYFAEQFNQPLYEGWLINEVLSGRISAPGFIEAWRKGDVYVYGAWVWNDWSGAIKPSVDMGKLTKAYGEMVDRGWLSNERASRELSGTKFSRNMKRNARANKALVEMRRPLAEFADEYSNDQTENTDTVDNIADK